MNAHAGGELAIRSGSPSRGRNATEGSLLLWSLTDFRRFWLRYRATAGLQPRPRPRAITRPHKFRRRRMTPPARNGRGLGDLSLPPRSARSAFPCAVSLAARAWGLAPCARLSSVFASEELPAQRNSGALFVVSQNSRPRCALLLVRAVPTRVAGHIQKTGGAERSSFALFLSRHVLATQRHKAAVPFCRKRSNRPRGQFGGGKLTLETNASAKRVPLRRFSGNMYSQSGATSPPQYFSPPQMASPAPPLPNTSH